MFDALLRFIRFPFPFPLPLRVLLRTPKGDYEVITLWRGDEYNITTGKSRILLRFRNNRTLEILLAPPSYVKKNWEGVNWKSNGQT